MLYSRQHNVVVYDVPPPQIQNLVSGCQALSSTKAVVPCTLSNMMRMRRAGYPAYSPILEDYDWPSNPRVVPQPFPQQRHMAAFLTLHPRAFNLSDMRTGKTLALLWAADYMMNLGYIKKMLIVAPLSILHRTWEDCIKTHLLGRRTCAVLHGRDRLNLLKQDVDFYIINYDGLGSGMRRGTVGLPIGSLAATIAARQDIDAIAVDEGSAYKDPTTSRFRVMRQLIKDKPFYWHLTGTPTPNSPLDAWAQRKLVDPNFGTSYNDFKDRTMTKVTNFKWAPKPNAKETVAATLQPAIRYDRHACLGTMKTEIEICDVPLSVAQKKAYDDLKRELALSSVSGKVITAINEAALRLKLIQVACGAVYDDKHEIHLVDCQPRLEALRELIDEAPNKVLIFAPLTSVVKLLYSELSKDHSVAMITGATSPKDRNDIFRNFQTAKDPRIIVGDPGPLSRGLDLTEADTIIWYAPTDLPEVYTQANCRIEGINQKGTPAIYGLAATYLEREAFRRLDRKESLQGLILGLVEDANNIADRGAA